jgi:hypothetical protein
MRSEGQFDVIVSEPSNPWVTGVEMLFSREFLEAAKSHLAPGGVHAQWIHQYEIDDASLALVLRTYASVFEHVSVWTSLSADLVVLGFQSEGSGIDHFRLRQRAAEPAFAASLRRSGIASFTALLAHELIPLGVIHASHLEGPLHTLLHPRLNDMAGRAFFRNAAANLPFAGARDAAREGVRRSMLRGYLASVGGRLPDAEHTELVAEACKYRRRMCRVLLADWLRDDPGSEAQQRAAARAESFLAREAHAPRLDEIESLFAGAAARDGFVTPDYANRITDLYQSDFLPGVPFDPQQLLGIWSRCRDESVVFESCEGALQRARAASPLEDDASLRGKLAACQKKPAIGPACQEGLSRAQRLLLN